MKKAAPPHNTTEKSVAPSAENGAPNSPASNGRPNRSGKKYKPWTPGGKNSNGVYQILINLVPPHKIKYECFAGSAMLTRLMKPSEKTFVVEIDNSFTDKYKINEIPGVTVLNEDAFKVLSSLRYVITEKADQVFIWCDPPYPRFTRRSPKKKIFKYDLTIEDHERLCKLLITLPFKIAISSYRNPVYDEILQKWNRFDYTTHAQNKKVIESVYYNYDLSNGERHDYAYVGHDRYRRREVRNIAARMIRRLNWVKPEERQAILYRISESFISKKSEL